MRRRISLTMVAMVVGALLFAGLATVGLTVLDSVHQTESELVVEAKGLLQGVGQELSSANHHNSLSLLRTTLGVLKGPLKLQGGAVLVVRPDGSFFNPLAPDEKVVLPSGLSVSDVQTARFFEALPVSGHQGRLAWAALLLPNPMPVAPGQSADLVVVLTRQAPAGIAAAGLWFAVASAITVIVALAAANRLGHRIARPLQQTEEVTSRIAAGDLDARVPVPEREGHELVSLATSVNQMASNLAQAQGAQRQFLMSVSHDLRTPLTSIRGFSEALADGTADDVQYAAGIILAEARRLERLVADLLELAKIEGGAFSLHWAEVDLGKVVAEATRAFEPAAGRLGLSIDLVTPPVGGVLCRADPDRLGQVVANVVENALKYAASRVSVTASAGGGTPLLSVEDDGPGIPAGDLGKVFRRLYQSPSAASRKLGSGLGLAIVDELVRAMSGRVRAESPLSASGGTRIIVELQVSDGAAGASGASGPEY